MTKAPSWMKDLHGRYGSWTPKPFSRVPIAKTCPASSTLATAPSAPKQDFRFVARQPILNREQQVFGYELLFRDGIENFFRASDLEAAARHTLDSTLLMGFDVLCDGQRAFINCTRDLLLKDGITVAVQLDGGRDAGKHRTGRPGDRGLRASEDRRLFD